MMKPSTLSGHPVLKKGDVPVLSEWNKLSISASPPTVWEPREETHSVADVPENLPAAVSCSDHDYCSFGPQDPALVEAHQEFERLKAERAALRRQLEEMVLRSRFGLERFAGSDKDIRFYTRFASYAHLMSFWSQIEQATRDMVPATRAQCTALPDNDLPEAPTSLRSIDEFFLFMTCLSVGLVPEDLAHRFQIQLSDVIQIIFTWANFLYTILGAIGIWLDKETIKQNLPEAFSGFSDTHLVLESTMLRCHIPEHLLLHTAPSSGFITHNIFKGMIGMAPHGPVMFVSPLYEGNITDRDMVKQSGLVSLLQPSMAVMVSENFPMDDLVPCKVHVLESQNRQQRSGAGDKKLRVHLEYLKGRVKEYELFRTVIPFSLTGCVNQLFTVACLLVNYQNVQLKPRP